MVSSRLLLFFSTLVLFASFRPTARATHDLAILDENLEEKIEETAKHLQAVEEHLQHASVSLADSHPHEYFPDELSAIYQAVNQRVHPHLHQVSSTCPRVFIASSSKIGQNGAGHTTEALLIHFWEAIDLDATLVIDPVVFRHRAHGLDVALYGDWLNLFAGPSIEDVKNMSLVAETSTKREQTREILEKRPCNVSITATGADNGQASGYCGHWCPFDYPRLFHALRPIVFPLFWRRQRTNPFTEEQKRDQCVIVCMHVRLGDVQQRNGDREYFANVFSIIHSLSEAKPGSCLSIHVHYSQGGQDLDYVRDSLPNQETRLTFHANEDPLSDLTMMVFSDIFILSESSFSNIPTLFIDPRSLIFMPPPKEGQKDPPTAKTRTSQTPVPTALFLNNRGVLEDLDQIYEAQMEFNSLVERKALKGSSDRNREKSD